MADLNAGAASSSPFAFESTPSGLGFVFLAEGTNIGVEPHFSSGVAGSTLLLADIDPNGSSTPTIPRFASVGNALLFAAKVGNQVGMWRTDGTAPGTLQVLAPLPLGFAGPNLADTAALGGFVYFELDGLVGSELYRSDGTLAGTQLVVDLAAGPSASNPSNLTRANGEVYFFAESNALAGRDLYATSGTAATTRLVKDLPLATGSNTQPEGLTLVANRLFLTVYDGSSTGREPWISDGTANGTRLLADLAPGLESSIDALPADQGVPTFRLLPNGGALFSARTPSAGHEWFGFDGTLVSGFAEPEATVGSAGSQPTAFGLEGGALRYFAATASATGKEPYVVDALGQATLLADINPGVMSSSPGLFTSHWVGDRQVTLFRADSPGPGYELWATDGTPTGTIQLGDILAGTGRGIAPSTEFVSAHGWVYFQGGSLTLGSELFRTDGTLSGTQLFYDIYPGPTNGFPNSFRPLGDLLVFAATDPTAGNEVWVSDGTHAGTHVLVDLNVGGNSLPKGLTLAGDKVLFFAIPTGQTAHALYSTDGTALGTTLIDNLGGATLVTPNEALPEMGGAFFFVAQSPSFGAELWRTDGTSSGTYRLTDLAPGPLGMSVQGMAAWNDVLFFEAAVEGSGFGTELYVSDGTSVGTHLVADLAPGPDSAFISDLVVAGNTAYFSATTKPGTGLELFQATPSGIVQVCDPTNDTLIDTTDAKVATNPHDLFLAGGKLHFAGTSIYGVGHELFVLDLPLPTTTDLGPAGDAFRIHADDPILGQALHLSGSLAPGTAGVPGGPVILGTSAPVAQPTTTFLSPGFALWLNPLQFQIQGLFNAPSFGLTLPLPNHAGLVGLTLNVQAFAFDDLQGPQLVSSNALQLTLGN